jgi:hypothetical protein
VISNRRLFFGVASLFLNSFQGGILLPPRSDVKHRNDDSNNCCNQRANSNVESPARVIKPLLFSRYLVKFFLIPLNVFFSERFSDELLLGFPPVTSEPRLLMLSRTALSPAASSSAHRADAIHLDGCAGRQIEA